MCSKDHFFSQGRYCDGNFIFKIILPMPCSLKVGPVMDTSSGQATVKKRQSAYNEKCTPLI